MADVIPEPSLAPPTPNVIYDITPPASDVVQPTPEEIAAYEKVAGPPPAPAFNPIAELSAEELANLAVKDKSFDIASTFRSSPDLHGDPAMVQKAADGLNLIKQRGFKLEDLPSLPEAGTAVLHTAKGFGKQLWNYANAAGGIVQTAIADVVGATEFSSASANEVNRRLAGNIAGTEEAVSGLAQMAAQGVGKAGRALGITKSHADKTPEDRVADLWSDVGRSEVQQKRLTGQGPFSLAVTAGTSGKADLNPEDVSELAAGDPFSFYLFGAAGKLAGAAVPLAARTAIKAGTEAATEAAGRAAQVMGGKVVQGIGKAVGGTAGLVEKAAPIVSPIAGAAKGGALYGPAGIAGGFIAGERAGKILAGGARRVGGVADNLAELGRDIASSAPVKSAYAQAGRDFLQALPGATFETAKGVGLDLGLAAATSESPAETQGAIGFGTALSAAHGAARVGGRVISGQLIAPREYGISTPQPSSGQFPSLDALHQQGFQQSPPAVRARLNAMRQFAKGAAGTDVYYAPDSAGLRNALSEIGVNDAQAESYSQHQGFFTTSLPGKDGSSRRIVVVTAPEAAPHESFHAIQDVIGEAGNQQIDQIVREAYADQWDARGTDYATRLAGGDLAGKTWQEAINDSTGAGMAAAKEKVFQQIYNSIEGQTGAAPSRKLVESLAQESYGRIMDDAVARNPQVATDQIALHLWREILSPEEAAGVADKYMARELAAENFDAIFKHAGPTLTEGNTLPAKLARIAGRVMTVFGMDPLEGRVSTTIDAPLKAPVVEAVRRTAQGRLPEVAISPRGEKAPIGKTPTGTPAEEARAIADEAPATPTERGTMTQREMLGSVAESIAAREGVKINYLSAPGEPAAATTSNRQTRRDIIEAFRDMPAAARSLWEKTFFPERVRKTQGGKYQVFGWAPEVFAANAHKMAGFLTAHPELSPYTIDVTTKSFTPEAWQELYRDTQTFVQNQKAGQTGSGEPLVVLKSVTDRGFTAPASRASDAVSLDQNKADFINMLFNAKLPETPRVQSGKLPLNLAGQQISDATLPGRVEVPVRPRGEYTGAEAERQGITGFSVSEVNPLRNRIEAAAQSTGKPMPSLIEANQMLNLESIKELQRAPEQPEFRANTLTLQAGFAPGELIGGQFAPKESSGVETIRAAAVRWKPTGELFTGFMHSMALDQAFEKGVVPGIKSFEELYNLPKEQQTKIESDWDTGFYTSNDRFVSRAEAATIGEAAGQLRTKHEAGTPLDSDNVEMVAQFAPKDAMEDLKSLSDEAWQEKIDNFKGKNGGGLTGWAYDVGAEAKTSADLEAFRSTAALMSEATKAAMGAGQFDKAMQLAARAQAAGEAFEAATGTKLDGTAKDVAKFIREHNNPDFQYSMPASESKAGEPLNAVHTVADDYATQAGIDYNPKREFAKAPEALLKRVSDFYEKAEHAPTDPAVASSYGALAAETEAQYNSIVAAGYKLEPFSGKGEPYKTSADMVRDVRENKHLFYLETDKAYGAGGEAKNNLLLAPSGVEINGKPVPVNDLFRAVHDFFGHAKEGYQFGPRGEFNAWKSHSELYSSEAQGALAAETLAQNSFVNFGPHMRTAEGKIRQKGEPGFLTAQERPFGEQKNVVVPPEILREAGAARFAPKKVKEDLKFKGPKAGFSKAWIMPDGKAVQLGGTWHHEWLSDNPDVAKKFGLDIPPFDGGDTEGVRESALKKGFVRVVLNQNTGGLVVEARAKDWRKVRNTVQDMVERNLDNVDTMTVSLLDENATKVVDSMKSSLFNFDTDAEKMAALPFISTGEIRGQFAPAKFEDDGFAAALKKIRSGQESGQTFNTDGTVWNRGEAVVDLVPLASINVPQGKLTPEAFREALAPYADLLDEPTIKAGVFSFSQGGKPIVSIDINAVVPQEFRANSVEFAKANDQVAMWDAVKNENVETGGKGNTRLTKTNEIIDALDALTTGEPVDINEIKRQYAETEGRAEEQGALFAGGKEYVGNAAVANMTKAQLAENFPEVIIPRRRTDSIPSEITQSPLFKQAGSEAQAVDAFARRLVEFSNEYKNDPAFQAGAKWYSEFVPKLKKEFGADAQVMAELLAATSPQTAVGVNFAYAFDALQSLKSGRFDKTIVKFKQGLDMMDNGKWLAWYNKENAAGNIPKPPAQPTLPAFLEAWINKHDLKPRQSNGALYGTHSIPVLQVFARKWLTESRGPKTLNFVKNLVGEGHEATIDLWADHTMRRVGYSGFRNRWRILPGNVQGVSAPDFAFAQKAFRKAAEEMKMEPDALQGALWFAEKKLWHDKGWGRLDLGDFQAEMAKVPMMKAGYKQRVETSKQKATEKPAETSDLFTVEPRYKSGANK